MIFISGGTGYIGSYVVSRLLETTDQQIIVLTRSSDLEKAKDKLWKSLQMHISEKQFLDALENRIHPVLGDLTSPDLGMQKDARSWVVKNTTSIIHCGASLNRKSETKCAQVNLMGTLHMLELAKQIGSALSRFSFVSTVAVAGARKNETVLEDHSIDWNRKDYDPYARTKKFCEEMIRSFLPDTSVVIFRPSIVLGDSRFGETTQFDMAFAFMKLSKLLCLPFDPSWRLDIVPANYVGHAISDIHVKKEPAHTTYHLSAGENAPTYRSIAKALQATKVSRRPLFAPFLLKPFSWMIDRLNSFPRKTQIYQAGALMKVFLPYLHFNTVFDNQRVQDEIGEKPAAFEEYCAPFYAFLHKHDFQYPYKPLTKK